MKRALIVVAKRPIPGRTKTRLLPAVTPDQAAELYHCFLLDTLLLVHQVSDVDHWIAYTPEEALDYFVGITPPAFGLLLQEGVNLGERLHNALATCFSRGYHQAVIMNSDGPTLPPSYPQRAFTVLDDAATDVVIGPGEDGGYYLIGLKGACRPIFDVIMSTATVLRDTLDQVRLAGLTHVCLPSWYDVDTPDDLMRLCRELSTAPGAVAPHTRRCLSRMRCLTDHHRLGIMTSPK